MFEGTRIRLQVLAPTIDNPITRPIRETISDTDVEFSDSSFYDISGDPYNVVAAEFDIDGSRLNYTLLESSTFSDVDDDTGFNGYSLTFDALTGNASMSIRDARIVSYATSIDIGAQSVSFDDDSLFVNVDGLDFQIRDRVTIELGFEIDGTSASDFLTGGNGRDMILGGRGADMIAGNAGNDQILGGRGADHLLGGMGEDRFVYRYLSESTVTSSGRDTIHDFKQGWDRIDLRELDADADARGDQRFDFISSRGFSEEAGELRAYRRDSRTHIQADIDGDGSADFAIRLEDSLRLDSGDFLL